MFAVAAGAVWVAERRIIASLDSSPDHLDPSVTIAAVKEGTVATLDDGRLHVEERGEGPTVVLLHGHGATLGVFSKLAPRLAARHRHVIAVDQRGFGQSSPVPDGFAFAGLVDDVATVLEAAHVRDAVIVGHSMGGAVALGLAVLRPEVVATRVRGLVLLNSTARGPSDDRLHRAWVRALDWPVLERVSSHPFHGAVLTRGNFGTAPRRTDVEAARQIGLQSPVAARRGFARRLLGTDLTADLGAVEVPVLALAGASDRVVPPGESKRLVAFLPFAELHVYPGAGHMLPMERTDEITDRIVEFGDRIA